VSRREFWEMLKDLQAQHLTILVSTPYMDEASLCDRVAFIQTGQILAVDTPVGITSRFTKPLFAIQSANTYELIQTLRQALFTDACYAFGDSVHLTGKPGTETAHITHYLATRNRESVTVNQINAGIEDTFMELMRTH
jgi:ABC-2 type transport system ATP-binding protein